MEPKCPLCGVPRPADSTRCECGYVFTRPPAPYDPTYEDGLPRYVVRSWFTLVLLLIMSGTIGPGVCLVLIAMLGSSLVHLTIGDGSWIHFFASATSRYAFIFGFAAIGLDLLARRMLRCSLIDVKRGSQFVQLPVWAIGILSLIVCLIATVAQPTSDFERFKRRKSEANHPSVPHGFATRLVPPHGFD